jgi:hypothetical protein
VPDEVAVFVFEGGRLRGPESFSTLGMRIQNEQSGSSSLYAQPMAIEPVVEEQGSGVRDQESEDKEQGEGNREKGEEPERQSEVAYGLTAETKAAVLKSPVDMRLRIARGALETRLEEVLATLTQNATPPSTTERQGHLALLKRWYYRPEVRRTGEVFFPGEDGAWPVKAILRGIGRVAAKQLHGAGGEGQVG